MVDKIKGRITITKAGRLQAGLVVTPPVNLADIGYFLTVLDRLLSLLPGRSIAFYDAYFLADSRASTSRRNATFCYWVTRKVSEGFEVILQSEGSTLIDKRLRMLVKRYE